MSEQWPFPNEHFDDEPVDTDWGRTEIASGAYRYRQATYSVQESHTGSIESFGSAEEDAELAVVIEAGVAAEEELAHIQQTETTHSRQLTTRLEKRIEAGKAAQQQLVETHLRFAQYYALASMNIVRDQKSKKEIVGENEEEVDEVPLTPRRRIGAYADITRLRSRYADLEDRTQVANLALVNAASKYRPKYDEKGKPFSFIGFAKHYIHTELSKHAKTEAPGMYVTPSAVDKIYAAHKALTTYADDELAAKPEMAEEIDFQLQRQRSRETVPLDEISIPLFPHEEGEGRDDLEPLSLADVLHDGYDDGTSEVMLSTLRKQLESVLDTLSEREAGIISMRYGLTDGETKNLDDIGKVYGITRERVRQIEGKALAKLRQPSRSRAYRHYLNGNTELHDIGLTRDAIDGTGHIRTATGLGARASLASDFIALEELRHMEPLKEEEAWEKANEVLPRSNEQVTQEFTDFLFNTLPYHFQRSFGEAMNTQYYPKALVDIVNENFGAELQPDHIEAFWNNKFELLVRTLKAKTGDDFNLDRVTSLFSQLISERMANNNKLQLVIPESLDGQCNFMGAGLKNGELQIEGNVGDFAGYAIGKHAAVRINGSTGDFAGVEANGSALLHITGNTGHYLAGQGSGSIRTIVDGSAGDYCAETLNGDNAYVRIAGQAGSDAALGAQRGTVVVNNRIIFTSKGPPEPSRFARASNL